VVTEGVRINYPQDWPAYNRAQCEEKDRVRILLRALCDGIVEPPYKGRGRPTVRLADAVYGATMKVYTTWSGRRADTDVGDCKEKGLIETGPSYNTLFRYVEKPALRPLFQALVEEAASPLKAIEKTFAVDGTGFATNTYSRWYDHRHGSGAEKRVQR